MMQTKTHDKLKRCVSVFAALVIVLGVLMPTTQSASADAKAGVPVKVTLEGSNLPVSSFTIELSEGNLSAPMTETVTLSNGHRSEGITFDLGDLKVGIYEYTLKQVVGSEKDVTYDTRAYKQYVMVNSDGTVEQRAIDQKDPTSKADFVVFSNSYRSSAEEVVGDPPVRIRKKISGDKPEKTDRFTFTMTPDGNTAGLEENPLPAVDRKVGRIRNGVAEVYVTGEGEVEIGQIVFKKEGVYSYKVREKDEKIKGYYYDDATFDVKYTVTRNVSSGKLECKREILKNSKETVNASCVFDNTYDSGSDTVTRIWRGVKTGDPATMIPITAFCLSLIGLITFFLARHADKEVKRGQRK